MLNVVQFTYLHPEMIMRAAQVLKLGPQALKELTDRYVLIKNPNNVTFHGCPIHEIGYSDFETYIFDIYLKELKRIEEEQKPEEFEQVFPKTDDNIRRKIKNTLFFAMDKVYKCDKLLVTYAERIKSQPPQQMVPNAIHRVLQEDFEIIDTNTMGYECHTLITKRGNNNG